MPMEDQGDILKNIPAVVQFLYQVGSVVALPVMVLLYNKIISHTKIASNEATIQASNVRAALAISEKLTSEKLASIASAVYKTSEVTKDTHQIVNGAKAILLDEIVNLKLRIADITKDPDDYKIAEVARERLKSHLDTLLICKKDNCPDRVAIDSFTKWTSAFNVAATGLPKQE